jgi:hypothetical protein
MKPLTMPIGNANILIKTSPQMKKEAVDEWDSQMLNKPIVI